MQGVVERLRDSGAAVTQDPDTDQLLINDEYRAVLVLSRCLHTDAGTSRWLVRLEHGRPAHITIAVRMNEDNATIKPEKALLILRACALLRDHIRVWAQAVWAQAAAPV